MEKGSFVALVVEGFLGPITKIVEILGEKNAAKKILMPDLWYSVFDCDYAVPENALAAALGNDFDEVGRYFIRLLKANRMDIDEEVWKTGIKRAPEFCIENPNLDVIIILITELKLNKDFLVNNKDRIDLIKFAITHGKIAIAKYLWNLNSNPLIEDLLESTILHTLAFNWNDGEADSWYYLATQIVSKYPRLIYNKDSSGRLLFMTVACSGQNNALTYLLNNMTDPEFVIDCTDEGGNTALMLSLEECRPENNISCVSILLERGADIHFRNPINLWNAWHYALRPRILGPVRKLSYYLFILKTLVKNDVAPEIPDKRGDTFLHVILQYHMQNHKYISIYL